MNKLRNATIVAAILAVAVLTFITVLQVSDGERPAAPVPTAAAVADKTAIPIFTSTPESATSAPAPAAGNPAADLLVQMNSTRSFRELAHAARKVPENGGYYYAMRTLFDCMKIAKIPVPKAEHEQQAQARNALVSRCDISPEERGVFMNELNADRRAPSSPDPFVRTAIGALATAKTPAERTRAVDQLIAWADPLTIDHIQYIDTETPDSTGNAQERYYFNGRWYAGPERELLEHAWQLAVCDLGLNCGEDSTATLKLCATRGWCAPTLTDAIALGYSGSNAHQWQTVLRLKNEIVLAIKQKRTIAFVPG